MIKDVLLETETARRMYMNSPMFHASVAVIDAAEREGEDPWPAVRQCLVAMAEDLERLVDRLVREEMRSSPIRSIVTVSARKPDDRG